jgi:hypothetical protein
MTVSKLTDQPRGTSYLTVKLVRKIKLQLRLHRPNLSLILQPNIFEIMG